MRRIGPDTKLSLGSTMNFKISHRTSNREQGRKVRRLGQSPTLAPSGLGRGIAPIQITLNGPMVGDRVAAVEGEEPRVIAAPEQLMRAK